VSTIPTPFIGGADSPQHGKPAEQELEPPFSPQKAETAPDSPEPAPSQDVAEPQAPAAEEVLEADFLEPIEEQASEPVRIEITEAEPEPQIEKFDLEETPVEVDSADDHGLPDFLAGPDTAAPTDPSAGIQSESLSPQNAERLAELAQELLGGVHGDWIRSLVANLGAYSSEIAIPRAFAAGYMSAKSGEES
jgi:hypothetical protein